MVAQLQALPVDLKHQPPSLTAAATAAVVDSQRKECQKHQCLPSPLCSVPTFCCKFDSLNAECLEADDSTVGSSACRSEASASSLVAAATAAVVDSRCRERHNNTTSHCLLILLFFRAALLTAHTWLQITAQLGARVANLKRQPQSFIAAATVMVIKITLTNALPHVAFHC